MSGGRFNYRDSDLKHEIFGYGEKPGNQLMDREISAMAWDMLGLIHVFDLAVSGDTSMDSYLTAKREFKRKWLGNRGVRVRGIVDGAIADLKAELYATYGLDGDGP